MKVDREIHQFMIRHQLIFINILDLIREHPFSLSFTNSAFFPYYENNQLTALMVRLNGHYYLYGEDHYLQTMTDEINKNQRAFSVYSTTATIEKIKYYLIKSIRSEVKYASMQLSQSDFNPLLLEMNGYKCIPCNNSHFTKLKPLQYAYHLEEVYTDPDHYPYQSEMKNFKQLLQNRLNYAVFTDDSRMIPLSKAYVNAESSNAFQIGGVFTTPSYRKKGLSQLCLNHLLQAIFKHNKEFAILFVNRENQGAFRLYEKLGFKKIMETATIYF